MPDDWKKLASKLPAKASQPAPKPENQPDLSALHAKYGTRPRLVDLVFVIDTTGSMQDKIEGIIQTCDTFVDSFASLNLDHQVGIVAFGDLTVPGDRIDRYPFTSKVAEIKERLHSLPRFWGGSNEGESSLEAVVNAIEMEKRPGAIKVIVLVTDDHALQHTVTASDVTRRLQEKEILTYVISLPDQYFKHMAASTGGTWMQVTSSADFSALIDMLKKLATDISTLVSDVHRLSAGSVREHLKLAAPNK